MKVYTVKRWDGYIAVAIQDHQEIQIGPDCDTRPEAMWFAWMFRKALRRHDKEKANGK
jgi:hypothetical protein